MKISGTSTLSADRAAVYAALNDPAVLVATIPGCKRLEALGDDAYAMTVAAGVGSIKGVYDGQVRLSEQHEPASFRMHAQGSGAPGTIGADVNVTLEDADGGGTSLTYEADATVGGMIGGVGQRMLTGVSKKMAAEFFRNVDAVLTGTAPVAGAGRTGGAVAPTPSVQPGRPAPGVGAVFTAPEGAASGPSGFVLGVAVGAAAALAGAVVGGWIAGRRRS
jgi:uncharacterized protein